ncbi:hypothetical protein [Microvirga makkahensis]|uniref:hypothetical protein n=1 Tax=Microvirga makkahensis TaxID=1128670 RepID=UPI0014789A60|nr:hypothetical protein [Microvirga makkahensis]
MLHEEGCSDHALAIVHPARVPQLAHAGIDDGILPQPRPQGIQILRIVLTEKFFEARCVGFFRQVWVSVQKLVVKIAPDHLAQKLQRVPQRRGALGNEILYGVPHLTRADLTESQMRGEM